MVFGQRMVYLALSKVAKGWMVKFWFLLRERRGRHKVSTKCLQQEPKTHEESLGRDTESFTIQHIIVSSLEATKSHNQHPSSLHLLPQDLASETDTSHDQSPSNWGRYWERHKGSLLICNSGRQGISDHSNHRLK